MVFKLVIISIFFLQNGHCRRFAEAHKNNEHIHSPVNIALNNTHQCKRT